MRGTRAIYATTAARHVTPQKLQSAGNNGKLQKQITESPGRSGPRVCLYMRGQDTDREYIET